MSTSFEHSSMKSSFSLSSLRSAPAPPGGRCEQLERPYHSLTKKRKEPCREAWRRSWGSAASGGSAGDDLWPLLQHHYDYIMDNQIIDSCKEANSELQSHSTYSHRLLNPTSGFNRQWSLSQLISEFTELCHWLTHVQEEIYSSPENLSSRKLRMSRMTELLSVVPRRAKFIEQANAILERIPEASAEVTWRIEHLNVKWESLRLLLSPEQQYRDGDSSDSVDTAHEMKCLRRWLHIMEGRLPPPSLAAAKGAPYHELLRKLSEHKIANAYEVFEFFEADNATYNTERKRRRAELREECDPFNVDNAEFVKRYRLTKELAHNLCDELRPLMTKPRRSTDLPVETKIANAYEVFEFFEADNATYNTERKRRRAELREECDPFNVDNAEFVKRYRLTKELAHNLCDELRPLMTKPRRSTDLPVETKMANAYEVFEFFEADNAAYNTERKRRRAELREECDPFNVDNAESVKRYRLTKELTHNLCDELRPLMTNPRRSTDLPVETKVLQRDVECHGRIVNSVVRLCGGGDAVRALERRWHLLYLRAIEWQCHLEACLAKIDNQGGISAEAASDSDDEPVLKQPRLSRKGSPRRQRTPVNARRRESSLDSRQSASEEEQEHVLTYQWRGFGSDCESELERSRLNMADERRVPGAGDDVAHRNTDQTVPVNDDQIDGLEAHSIVIEEKVKSPPTVIKRKKPVDTSKFNQTDRKSKHLATFYFRHHDTDSDRQMIETEKSQEESSEEEWTYVGGVKIGNEDSTDIMTSSVEIQCELPIDGKKDEEKKPPSPKPKLESSTPDLLKVESTRCKDIERLVNQAEELVQKHALAKKKGQKSFKPLSFEDESKNASRNKMSRIKEWLNQSTDDKNDTNQGTESYDASGEYTTESEVDNSLTSEDRNLHSSMDMSTSTCTVTPTHHAKVQLRKKRAGNSARPWSVSCLSQLSGAHASLVATPTTGDVAAMSHNMSISESALNTLTSPQRVTPANSNSKLRGSSTTVQGHVSSTNTMTEACTSCVEANDKQCWLRRKRLKLRRNNTAARRERLVKSLSFCGRLSPEIEDKHERSAASDPATSRKSRFDTTSTSGNDSDEELIKQQLATIAHLRKSIEKTHISTREPDSAIPEQNEPETVAPSFKLGPAEGSVRPRLARSLERERNFIALSLGDPSQLWDLSIDKDSDVDKSVTAGTEEHSSFSEQAWDFYQEKYNSEPYSEAPDSDAARRLLEFGDDYRAFLDSQSDCCSSLSAQPENDQSPSNTRRRRPPSDVSRERSLPRYKRPTRNSPIETPFRKPKKSMSSAERKKTLLDSLERSRNNTSIESSEGVRRRKPSENERKNSKRSPEFDLLNVQALSRRRHSSNLTSDEINSSLEYAEVNNRPDILDSLSRRRRTEKDGETELQKVVAAELRRRSAESGSSADEARCWGSSGSEGAGGQARALLRHSGAALAAAEAALARHDAEPDLLRAFDYTEIVTRCRENINLLDAALAGGTLSTTLQRDVRAVSARWSALRAAATRRGGARRLRREMTALRETLDDICEPGDCAPQPHTRAQLHRRIEELKERLSRLLECKVSMLKLTVSIRRALGDMESDDGGLATDLAALLAAWDDAHQRTSNELLSLEKAVCAWAEWESALRELQGALRGDLATLEALRDRGAAVGDQTEVAAQIKQLAASLVDKKKGGSTCDSLSDSGISDGDSEGAGRRARRLGALRELARRLQAALAHNSPAQRAIAKRMEQTENEVRTLQESCRVLVEQSIPDLKIGEETSDNGIATIAGSKTGAGDPDYSPRGGWVWRVLRSSLPIQLCLVALLLAAWLVERPRCCDALNSLAQTLTPQLRYVRGPPPV